MRNMIFLLIFLLIGNISYAQQKQITGTVTNKSDGTPLEGVTVQSGNNSTITDASGKFTITGIPGSIIRFSFTGKKAFNYKVENNDAPVSIQMETDAQNLDEIVVV